ncbi:RNA polymerase sigma factor [Sphingosinicella microcystinivorans]|uniref:RNA polymerase sigma factor n=1 Tax=Sphingosinicella microcystinivorans TaxID=335406 RepID=A0AAD1D547_SPHMI|nr:RNA polymerase sigma factor [Sphingosinicella microcystinivorans]RKS91077.1 RNA polymerase sigma-70 factor (ECF subfamily) [Sphingosinicella microcystinivorans]BBE33998.1 hypothetical protein SmB9_16560 [Sphingosinicella microcystinivorans]
MSSLLNTFIECEMTLRRVVSRYRRRADDVDDLVQEVFLRTFVASEKQDIGNLKAFLIRVAKNLAISEATKKNNSATEFFEDSNGYETLIDERHGTVEEQVDGRQKLFILSQAIASLQPELRQALWMCKVDKLKFKQIAEKLGVSVSTVEKRVAAALIACNAYLRNQGYDPAEFSGGALRKTSKGAILTMKAAGIEKARKSND